MFNTIDYLQLGNEKQINAYNAINKLGIMDDLREYNPTLCGTFPIGIDIVGSDLDIIMDVSDFLLYEKRIVTLYGGKEKFILKKPIIRGVPLVKAKFVFGGFEFELFAQPQPVKEQYAFQHMIIENALLEQFPYIRAEVIRLKKEGMKTEPAFCKIFELVGDPYESLLQYGRRLEII